MRQCRKIVRSWRGSGGVEPIINEHREAAMFKSFCSLRNDDDANNNIMKFPGNMM